MDRLQLPHGCSCSRPKIHPKNHKSPDADLSEDWCIHYRFYDPRVKEGKHAKGKLVIKKGMNDFKTHSARLAAAYELLEDELYLLEHQGYNPITKKCVPVAKTLADKITPDTLFPDALDEALERLDCTKKYKNQIKIGLVHIKNAIFTLKFHRLRVQDVRIRETTLVLEQVGIDKNGWSASNYNHHRTYLYVLFKRIVPLANMSGNPIHDIPKKLELKKLIVVLTKEQRFKIHQELKITNYRFWRYIHIFFSSHGRSTELFKVYDSDVDLENNRFKCTVLKGELSMEVWKPIKDVVKPLWREIMREVEECREKGIEAGTMTKWTPILLFSTRLQPGIVPVNPETISKKWRTQVKKRMNINSNFYRLKHLNSTEISESMGTAAAAALNSHTSDAMVKKIYDVNYDQRELDRLKKSGNGFA